MELSKFVETALVQLAQGVGAANRNVYPDGKANAFIVGGVGSHSDVPAVEFDVALTVEQSKGEGAEAKIGVFAGWFGATGEGKVNYADASRTVSRVRFKVHVPDRNSFRTETPDPKPNRAKPRVVSGRNYPQDG